MSTDRNGTEVEVGDIVSIVGTDRRRTVVAVATAGVYVVKQPQFWTASRMAGQPQFLRDADRCYVLDQKAEPRPRRADTAAWPV